MTMTMLSFKVTEAEEAAIRERARRERRTVSEYLRRAALPEPRGGRVKLVRAKRTGALVFAGPAGGAPLTGAKVRALLADFP